VNDFKHVPGVAGLVTYSATHLPAAGLTVSLVNTKGKVLQSVVTDANGTYVITYKQLGKSAGFYIVVNLPGGGTEMAPVTLGNDGFCQINFDID
jgi:uncharacterized protein YfaS (alpha-2-macroglobulin family)